MLVRLKVTNALSARQACIMAFWASRAGVGGDVARLGLWPGADSGKYLHRFDAMAGTPADAEGMYQLCLACRLRHDASRRWEEVPVLPPLELLAGELAASGEAESELRGAIDQKAVPPVYWNHRAVKQAEKGELVHPVSLYIDGVGCHRHRIVLGLWVYFTLTGRRRSVAVLWKPEMCSCGCGAALGVCGMVGCSPCRRPPPRQETRRQNLAGVRRRSGRALWPPLGVQSGNGPSVGRLC